MKITPFSELVTQYRVILLDAYGVLKNATGILPGVPELLRWLTGTGKDVYVLTNDASRPPDEMMRSYIGERGEPLVPTSRIISSGLLAKDFLRAKVKTGNVAYLGKARSAFYVEAAGLNAIPLLECTPQHNPQAIVMLDDEGYDWFAALNHMLNLVRASDIPVVVANSDLVYPVRDGQVSVAIGALARMLEQVVGKCFIHCGKPDSMMFSYAFACAYANNDRLNKSDVLMVGDTLHTDIFGGNKFGIDTALVLSGNTARLDAQMHIASSGISPTYICESVLT